MVSLPWRDAGLQGGWCSRLLVSNTQITDVGSIGRIHYLPVLWSLVCASRAWYLSGATRINNKSLRNATGFDL